MEALAQQAPSRARTLSTPVAGVVGGLIAGAAYLVAQSTLTGLARTGGMAEPLQRIAAILLGPDAAPPPAELTATVFGMSLIIHFALAMVFGRVVGIVACRRALPAAVLAGAGVGLALYAINFHLIAPLAFPWFEDSLRIVTIVDHALFGAVAGAACSLLSRRER